MTNFFLSIVIPTYNRCKYLSETLECLYEEIKKATVDIEIVISDNHSTDNTSALITSWKNKLNIKYLRNKKNIGPCANLYNSIEKASSKYVLISSDDDTIRPGSLNLYIDLILKENPSIIYSNANFMDHLLENNNTIFLDKAFKNFKEDKIYKFKNGIEFYNFSEKFYCGFTGILMKRNDFLNSRPDKFLGTCFLQAGSAMVTMSKQNAKVFIINKKLWNYRLGEISTKIKSPEEIVSIGFGLLTLFNEIKQDYPIDLWLKIYMKELNWVRSLLIGIKSREGIPSKIQKEYLRLIDNDRKFKFLDSIIINFPDIIFKISYNFYRIIRYGKLGY